MVVIEFNQIRTLENEVAIKMGYVFNVKIVMEKKDGNIITTIKINGLILKHEKEENLENVSCGLNVGLRSSLTMAATLLCVPAVMRTSMNS